MGDMTELSYTNKIQLVRTTTSSMLSMPIVFAVSNEQGHTKDSTISGIFLLDPLLKFIYSGGQPDSGPGQLN